MRRDGVVVDRIVGVRQLLQRVGDVHGAGRLRGRVLPRHRSRQRPVDLDRRRVVLEARTSAAAPGPAARPSPPGCPYRAGAPTSATTARADSSSPCSVITPVTRRWDVTIRRTRVEVRIRPP